MLLLEFGFHGWAQFFKARLWLCLDIREQDNVVSKIGFHHIADIPFSHRESCFFERLDHRTQSKEVQISAGAGRPRIFGRLPGNFRKSSWCLANLRQ